MREIKFRGRRLDSGTWVYGSLFNSIWRRSDDGSRVCYIFPDNMLDDDDGGGDSWEDFAEVAEEYEVDPATVGQSTGMCDKNGKEIYEGDILRVTLDFSEELVNREVYYLEDGFCIHIDDETDIQRIVYAVYARDAEVIGNIHDNPELLKEANDDE